MNEIMKRIPLAILALTLTIPLNAQFMGGSYKDLEDSETVSALKEHVTFLSSTFLEGRAPGSEGELEAAIYLTEIFDKYGLDVLSGPEGDEFGVMQESGDTLTSRNVIAYIPGYDASLRNNYIVIGARLDNTGTSMMTVDGEARIELRPAEIAVLRCYAEMTDDGIALDLIVGIVASGIEKEVSMFVDEWDNMEILGEVFGGTSAEEDGEDE